METKKAKRAPRSKSRVKSKAKTKIPQRQLDLPAGYSADGKKLVPLRDVISPKVPTMELSQLSSNQQARLTEERIRKQRNFELGMVGVGVVNKARAIAEVKAQSDVGRTLIEIENRALRMLIDKGKSVAASTKKGRRTT